MCSNHSKHKIFTMAVLSVIAVCPFEAAATEIKNPDNKYSQTNFVADKASYKAQITEKKFINAWGISNRPAGSGGHFWVTAKDVSYEYVGDVQNSPDEKLRKFHTDGLKYVKLPVGGNDNFATGTVFSGSKENFVIKQELKGKDPIMAPAKFMFASDGGIVSAWTERKKEDGTFDWPSEAIAVIDESKEGAQFFGLAISANYDRLYAADFGEKPAIKVYDGKFKRMDTKFDMPFDDNKNGSVDPGEYAPFNIQAFKTPEGKSHVFVAYAKTQACPDEEIKGGACKKDELFVGEEDTSKPGYGRLAEFDENGKLVAVWNDEGKLSAPWGLAFAPADFGALSNTLLVANFGDGTIAGYDAKTRKFVDFMRGKDGKPIVIDKVWGLLFGNGASLGDTNALYFAAGPKDETEGLFGSLRLAK
jgi:uncharacterized protein (TIGR03118 family)